MRSLPDEFPAPLRGGYRSRRSRLELFACGLAVLLVFQASAQTATGKPPPRYDYLFVVDTSFSMALEKQALADTVFHLLRDGIAGKARPGDQLGLWTFNQQVYSRRFPPETWTPERSEIIADRVARYLRSQKFEKQSRLDKAIAGVLKAAKDSKSLTVFLLSDGDSPIMGTPFDRSLNFLYRENYRDLHRARKPFVTTFVAVDGQLVAWAVAAGDGAVRIPETPRPLETVALTEPSVSTVTNAPSLSHARVEAIKDLVVTNPPVEAPKQSAALPDAKTLSATPPSNAEVKPNSIPEKAAVVNAVEPLRPLIEKSDSGTPSPISVPPKPDQTQPGPAAQPAPPSESQPPPSESTPKVKPRPALPKTETETKSAPDAPPTLNSPRDEARRESSEKPATKTPLANPPQHTAIVVSSDSAWSSGTLALLGVTLLVVASSVLYWAFRSQRSRSQPSLISRSLDQEGK